MSRSSGILKSQPVVRRTWAPQGQTPIQYSWDRHDRLSTMAALTLAPYRRRLGLYFQLQKANIRFEDVMAFLHLVHRNLRRKFILVLDRYSVHRKAVRLLQEAGVDWFEVEWLLGYAPDLNPVEMVWNHTKYADLANFIAEDIDHLGHAETIPIEETRQMNGLKLAFFAHAGLDL
jgi:transposase